MTLQTCRVYVTPAITRNQDVKHIKRSMKKVKQLILNAMKAMCRNLFLRKEHSSIEPCHNVIESEKEHRENIEEWQRISHIIECASQKRLRVISLSPEPNLYQEWLKISHEERMMISRLIEEFYRGKEKELIEKIKTNI